MLAQLQQSVPSSAVRTEKPQVKPSIIEGGSKPFTLDQELTPFGRWIGDTVWVPPKDASREMARSMLRRSGVFSSKEESWEEVLKEHRAQFTQVRAFELCKPSIRLPKGRVFVTVTEQKDFGSITDKIPSCVQTRLDEFLAGPGRRRGVKVYYLKPLCVEVGDQLIFTTQEELNQAVKKIQDEVFSAYRRMYLPHRTSQALLKMADMALAIPRHILTSKRERTKREVDAYHAKLEFHRRKLALRATSMHRKWRTDGCEFEDMLSLTNPLKREDVIEQYVIEKQLSAAKRRQLLKISSVTLPWFIALPLAAYYVSTVAVTIAAPVMVCDPAFVAEMPDSKGVLLKIGHFDEIQGVTHVEI